MGVTFTTNNGIFSGIFSFAASMGNSTFDQLVECKGSVTISPNFSPFIDIFPPKDKNHVVINDENGYFIFTLKNFGINVSSYSIKSSYEERRVLTKWTLEGSYDNHKWKKIHSIDNCTDCTTNRERNYELNNEVFDSFRLTKLNRNNDSEPFYFDLFGFEVFGTIYNKNNCKERICTKIPFHFFTHLLFILLALNK